MTSKPATSRKPLAPPTLEALLLAPPAHEPGRCAAFARTTGEACKNWRVRGALRCRMHGGKGSGRPATTRKHTGPALRGRHFVRVVKGLLALYARKPEPVEVPWPVDSEAVTPPPLPSSSNPAALSGQGEPDHD